MKEKGSKDMHKLGVFQDFHDGTLKSVYEEDKKIIEMSLLFNKEDKDVVCVPTHHFCSLGCKMCHLTNKGLNKEMVPITVDYFIPCLIDTLTIDGKRRTSKENLLISFMGVGEPLLNLELIEEVYKIESYLKEVLGYRHIGYAISTMMPNDNMKKLNDLVLKLGIPLKVHFSLHTPIDERRKELIPSTKVTVEDALKSLMDYRFSFQQMPDLVSEYKWLHRTTDPTEIHYTLIANVNDTEEERKAMISLLKQYPISIKFIRFNPIHELERSQNETSWVYSIQKEIPSLRIKTYSPPGKEVGSSCGEFTKHYYHEEIETEEEGVEFETWKAKHLVLK